MCDRSDDMQFELHQQYHFLCQDNSTPWFRDTFSGLSFSDRMTETPLQAADVLAYEGYRYLDEHVLGPAPTRKPRRLLESLARQAHTRILCITPESIKQSCIEIAQEFHAIADDPVRRQEFAKIVKQSGKLAQRATMNRVKPG